MKEGECMRCLARVIWPLSVMVLLLAASVSGAGAAPSEGEDLFLVKINGLIGFIDKSGQLVVPPRFKDASDFSEGLAAVKPVDSDKWGYIDATGNFVILVQFSKALHFSEGLAAVQFGSTGWGYIDKTGELVIAPNYGWPSYFRNGVVMLKKFGLAVILDKAGAVILETPYREVLQPNNGLMAFLLESGQMGFMNFQGQTVIPPLYTHYAYPETEVFKEKIAPVRKGPITQKGKFGFIDMAGKTVVDFQYDWAEQFSEGLAVVGINHRYGYVDTNGKLVIPLQFDEAERFSEGLAAVKVGELWGFIDKQGRMVIKPQFKHRMWGSPIEFHEGLAAVGTETGNGFVNKEGELIGEPIFFQVEEFSGGLARVRLHGRYGYINRQGEFIWPPTM